MKKEGLITMFLLSLLSSCSPVRGSSASSLSSFSSSSSSYSYQSETVREGDYTLQSTVGEVRNDKALGKYGPLLFALDLDIPDDTTLEEVGNYYIWYHNINPNKTVEIVNYIRNESLEGHEVFFDIYSEEEKEEDPEKRNTGLFFFRGKKNGKTAFVNAGGGFMYVGALQDSFPVALELSKKGFNAFALIYRPGAETACEDLARAIAFVHDHHEELGTDVTDYSLWGGSAGARMAAWLGNDGPEGFGEQAYPHASTVIMQYTGLSEVTGKEPPTMAVVGTNDGIASYRTMENRISRIKANGTDAEILIYPGLQHGFGLGEGTVAEGWVDKAVDFWQRHIK